LNDLQATVPRWEYKEIAQVILGTEGHHLDHRRDVAQAAIDANTPLVIAAQAALDANTAATITAQGVVAAHVAQPEIDAQAAIDGNAANILIQTAILNEGAGDGAQHNYTLADVQAAGLLLTQLNAATAGLQAALAGIQTLAQKQQIVVDVGLARIPLQANFVGLPTVALANTLADINILIANAGGIDHTDMPFVVLQFADANNLTEEQEEFVQRILVLACDERLNPDHSFHPHQYTAQMLWRRSSDTNPDQVSAYQYFTLHIDELNSFKQPFNVGHLYFRDRVSNDIPANARQAFLNILKEQRQVQIEINHARNFYHLKRYSSPFYDTYNEHVALVGNAAAQTVARKVPDTSSIKPFTYRSIQQFLDPLTPAEIGNQENRVGLNIFDVNDGGVIGQYEFGILSGGMDLNNKPFRLTLCLPVRTPFRNTLVNKDEVTIECTEPFFGYSTGANQLMCQEPLNQEKYGQKWPLTVQDYSYTFNQKEWVLDHGYIHDIGCKPILTATTQPEFTTISEMQSHLQHTKEMSTIYELSSTLDTYRKLFIPGTTPQLSLETQFGMFKYIFMYVSIPQTSHSTAYPSTNPVITSFNYAVRGRENVFVQNMDRYDIERLSRRNCHIDCNWRELHNKGQGVLLHLEDLGLTEEVPYGERGRIVLDITLLTTLEPSVEVFGGVSTVYSLFAEREFVVVLIRDNQILKGDWQALEFVNLNQ
jgi:hypothetical protein